MPRAAPAKGDLISLPFHPDHGHERPGRRPALVVSNDPFQRATGVCVVCPITRTDRPQPFHVPLPDGHGVEGFVLTDQVRSVDVRARGARRIGRAPGAVVDQVLAILDAMLF